MLATTATTLESAALPGRDYQISALGTWDGATVTLATYRDGAWRNIPDAAWTADADIVRTQCAGTALRLSLSSPGASTSLSLTIAEVPTR